MSVHPVTTGTDIPLWQQIRQKAQGSTDCAFWMAVADEVKRLTLSATASEKDAARYQWLRDKADPADCDIYLASDSAFVSFRAAAVDASIDAAMEKANG